MADIKVFETYEDAYNLLLNPYAGANDKFWEEQNERIRSFRQNYPGNEAPNRGRAPGYLLKEDKL